MSTLQSRRPGEIVFAIVLVAFSALASWQAYRISGFTKLSSPGVFPMIAAAAMLVSGLFVLRDTVRKVAGDCTPGTPDTQRSPGRAFLDEIMPIRLVVMSAFVVLYVIAMPWLGFLVASGLFLFASFGYLWRRPIIVSLGVSLLALGVVHFVFRTVFQVVLPKGSLFAGF